MALRKHAQQTTDVRRMNGEIESVTTVGDLFNFDLGVRAPSYEVQLWFSFLA